MTRTIPILASGDEVEGSRSGFEDILTSSVSKVIEIESSVLAEQLGERLEDMHEMLDSIRTKDHAFELDSVQLRLGLTTQGKLGLLSVNIANTQATSIMLTLKRVRTNGGQQ